MATRYDIEQFLKDIEETLKTKLNAKITEINTEKGDVPIETINAEAYIFQSLDDKVVSYNATVFYYIDDIISQSIHSATSEEVMVDVIIILSDAKDGTRTTKLLRYLRALKELFNEEFNGVKSSIKIKVESLVPISFALQNQTSYVDAIGVKLTTTLV